MLECILLRAHTGLQQLYPDFGGSIGLWVSGSCLLRDNFPRPVILQLTEEGQDGYFCIAAKSDTLISQSVQVSCPKLEGTFKPFKIDTFRWHKSSMDTFALTIVHDKDGRFRREFGCCWAT